MSSVIGITDLLLETDLVAQQREFAGIIRSSGESLLKILNEVLDYTKIEAGHLELEEADFDVRECLEDAVDGVAMRAAEKDLFLALLVDPAVPSRITGDQGRLRQILLNLINNAIKFTLHGFVVVRVALTDDRGSSDGSSDGGSTAIESPGEKAIQTIHFTVSDTGIGIPEDKMDRLFRSFSQVEASHARRFGGTGLGLVISKRLAEAMGGKM
jgi:signal transduction histidine kinase